MIYPILCLSQKISRPPWKEKNSFDKLGFQDQVKFLLIIGQTSLHLPVYYELFLFLTFWSFTFDNVRPFLSDIFNFGIFLFDIWQRSAFFCPTWLISAFYCSTFDNVWPFLSDRVVVTVVLVVSSSRVWRQIWHWSRAINVKKVSSTKKICMRIPLFGEEPIISFIARDKNKQLNYARLLWRPSALTSDTLYWIYVSSDIKSDWQIDSLWRLSWSIIIRIIITDCQEHPNKLI